LKLAAPLFFAEFRFAILAYSSNQKLHLDTSFKRAKQYSQNGLSYLAFGNPALHKDCSTGPYIRAFRGYAVGLNAVIRPSWRSATLLFAVVVAVESTYMPKLNGAAKKENKKLLFILCFEEESGVRFTNC
jgi:hypothetical protein